MAFIPVPNTVMVEMIQVFKANRYENTLYFKRATPWDDASMTSLGADLATWWDTQLGSQLSDQLSLDMIKLTSLESETANFQEFTDGLPQSGGSATDPLPPQDSMVVTFKTNVRGRSFRGRNYLVGFVESMQSGGEWNTTIQGEIETAIAGLVTVATDNDCEWVVVSRYTNNAPRVTGIATPVTGFAARPIVASQRRRRLGVGS